MGKKSTTNLLFSYYSLQIKFLPLLNFMRKKDDKVGKKIAYKKKGKWKKKRARKNIRNRFEKKNWLMRMPAKTKMLPSN